MGVLAVRRKVTGAHELEPLAWLGIGLQPPLASLGTMCNDASANLRTSPHELLIPALMICVIMFAFNFVGDGLRDALDPKLKK